MTEYAHPTREAMMAWVDGRIKGDAAAEIGSHVDSCEFCREFCAEHRAYSDEYQLVRSEDMPGELEAVKAGLEEGFLAGRTIDLDVLEDGQSGAPALAADGKGDGIVVRRVTTHYSEDPEIVLLVVPGGENGAGHLQLLADDPSMSSGVMIRADGLDREFVTDSEGLARIEGEQISEPAVLKWQVKLPDAVFQLRPLVFDPDRTEATHETTLETHQGDRIQLTVERKTVGRRIGVRILELDGRTDFGKARVVISRQYSHRIETASPDKTLQFELDDADAEVSIRLFL